MAEKRVFDFVTFADGHWAQLKNQQVFFKDGIKYFRMRLRPDPAVIKQYNIQEEESDKEGCIIRDFPALDVHILAEGFIDKDYEDAWIKTRELYNKLKIIGGDEEMKKYIEILERIVKTKKPVIGGIRLSDDPQTECKFFIFSDINGNPTYASSMIFEYKHQLESLQKENYLLQGKAMYWQEMATMAATNTEETVRKWKKIVDIAGVGAYVEPGQEESVQEAGDTR